MTHSHSGAHWQLVAAYTEMMVVVDNSGASQGLGHRPFCLLSSLPCSSPLPRDGGGSCLHLSPSATANPGITLHPVLVQQKQPQA
jgi:hypothetical protein